MIRVSVAVETPQYAGLAPCLDYLSEQPLLPGTLVRVPLGKRDVPGLVWDVDPDAAPCDDRLLKPVSEVLQALPPLDGPWRRLIDFSARYYQRSVGEIALAVLPPELRRLEADGLDRRLVKLARRPAPDPSAEAPPRPALSPGQAAVLATLLPACRGDADPACHLLHGVTGSGKTEVYLRSAEAALEAGRQALVLVPEINLTPQLEARFAERFPGRRLVTLHSGLTPAQRLQHWLLAHLGQADLVLGTRLAVFCPLPRLGVVVVDEEHDPSYKQQDGARYSARDLAVYRGHLERVPVLLGSATPSLETWLHAQAGRYRLLSLPERIGQGELPRVTVLDMTQQPKPPAGREAPPLAAPLLQAMRQRVERGEQTLLFLNRRGFAPVLGCSACGWKSGCPHCSAWRVFHKRDRTLRCHHCGFADRVPRACPDCGNLDIEPIGRGTERLEEQVAELLQDIERPGGGPVRVARIDADSTRLKGSLEAQLAAVHAGDVDVLVGTQMVTKGHDFRRVTLVAAVNPDGALFTSDFRAPERLFATLMQAAGRAGRDAQAAARSEMWIQTWTPGHALFAALRAHDFAAFAQSQLAEREMAGLPPYSHLALLRCEARDPAVAEAFLREARDAARALMPPELADELVVYSPVAPHVAKVAGFERRQMLLEARSRARLQWLLAQWAPQLGPLRAAHKGLARWAVDVDPLDI
ncbi:primosomal protein N' [Ideonella sp. 4Y11]|uniref:Replication restart protein PriA n=1 Tax=Ideonella aquatica TaxID=2824119 RepID=A0A941BI14_9BURK|nr:primosomal protein N' [Ideonella aquatica]MBQ0961481.1 primosomal protein N' [Ideonella aquatica]